MSGMGTVETNDPVIRQRAALARCNESNHAGSSPPERWQRTHFARDGGGVSLPEAALLGRLAAG